MYAAKPDLSACSQEQLLQLLRLADSYGVLKVLEIAAAAFASIAAADLQWNTVLALYALQPGCAELVACKPLFAAAATKLQQELGDLELTWADEKRAELLLRLPQPALLQLLQHPETRVASENTVFYNIKRWWQSRVESSSTGPAQSVKALAELVRIKVWQKTAPQCHGKDVFGGVCT
jgi:hypothetical protein